MTNFSRRDLLRSGSVLATAGTVVGSQLTGWTAARAQTQPAAIPNSVKALFFDVFGTLVDWRSGLAREAKAILGPLGHSLDWPAFADAWVDEYQPAIEEIRSGRVPFTKLDVLFRQMLDTILPGFGINKLPEEVRRELAFAWHRLDGWPDVKPGLERLSRRFILAPVSNGNFSLMADLAKRNGWRWDAILGSDIVQDYKPKPRVYLSAVEAFDLQPGDCMMVAAHNLDLAPAAGALGLHTTYVARPDEFGPGEGAAQITGSVDISVKSLEELADKLGA